MGQSLAKLRGEPSNQLTTQRLENQRIGAFTSENSSVEKKYNLLQGETQALELDWRFLEEALDKTIFFNEVSKVAKRNIVQDMYLKQFSAGQLIIQEGSSSQHRALYVVKSGELEVVQKRNGVGDRVNKKQKGDVFGEQGVLFDQSPKATVAAMSNCEVYVLERSILKYHMRNLGEFSENIHDELFLNCVPTLQNLSKENKRILIENAQQRSYEEGTTVVRQGDQGDTFYIIREGTAEVLLTSVEADGTMSQYKVNQLFQADFFGDRSLILREPRDSTVVAGPGLVCLVIPKHAFDELCKEHMPTRETHQSTDYYQFAKYERRLKGKPSSVKAEIVIYRKNDPDGQIQDENLSQIAQCIGHNEEVTELINIEHSSNSNGYPRKMELVETEILGQGAFSTVSVVTERSRGVRYALKRIEQVKVLRCCEHVFCEQAITKNIFNDFCMRQYASFKDDTYLYMLFDLLEGGDLYDLLISQTSQVRSLSASKSPQTIFGQLIRREHPWEKKELFQKKKKITVGLSEELTRFYVAQVLLALEYLHSEKIVYRDVKPDNVLLDKQGYCKLGDFGFSKKMDSEKTFTFCGTPGYVAPENVLQKGYGFSVDMWSLGVLMYVLLTGQQPFGSSEAGEVIVRRICDSQFAVQYPYYLSPTAKDLLSKLLVRDVDQRMCKASDIKAHPWFRAIDFDKLKAREYNPKKFKHPKKKTPTYSVANERIQLLNKQTLVFPNKFHELQLEYWDLVDLTKQEEQQISSLNSIQSLNSSDALKSLRSMNGVQLNGQYSNGYASRYSNGFVNEREMKDSSEELENSQLIMYNKKKKIHKNNLALLEMERKLKEYEECHKSVFNDF